MLRVEVHLPDAQSLKDKRSRLNSVRDQMRSRFNVAVAQLDANEKWQRATIGIAALGDDRAAVVEALDQAVSWVRGHHLVSVVHIEEEYW